MSQGAFQVGWQLEHGERRPLLFTAAQLARHAVVTGASGQGKSGAIEGMILSVLRSHAEVNIVAIEAKGELVGDLLDRFLPRVVERRSDLIDTLAVIRPFSSRYVVPLNLLAPATGVEVPVQAAAVASVLEPLFAGSFGARMTSALAGALRPVIEVQGSLIDVIRILESDEVAARLAVSATSPESRSFLVEVLPAEGNATRRALSARLRWLLTVPCVERALCARGCIGGSDLLERPLTLVDVSGAPLGFSQAARVLANLVVRSVLAAGFDRVVDDRSRPVALMIDEAPEVVRASLADDVERALEQLRWKRLGVVLAAQSMSQIADASPSLSRSCATNARWRLHLAGDPRDIDDLYDLVPVTGTLVDPAQPDRLLTRSAEQEWRRERLTRLPERTGVFVDRDERSLRVFESLALPYERAKAYARDVSEDLRVRLARGAVAVPVDELARARVMEPAATPSIEIEAKTPAKPGKRTPKLVLP